MATQLPPDEIRTCPKCLPEIDALTGVLKSRFPDSATNPAGIAPRVGSVLILAHYYLGILHQSGHPTSLADYSMSLKRAQVPIHKLNDCLTCQDENAWAANRAHYLFPGFAGNPEGVQPEPLAKLCRVIYWLGILHELEHPVPLTDYAEAIKTGDFYISPPPLGEASNDC